MPRRLTLLAAALVLGAVLAPLPARACAPVLVRRDGTIVNLDTGVEIRPGGLRTVLGPRALARLVARHEKRTLLRLGPPPAPHHRPRGPGR